MEDMKNIKNNSIKPLEGIRILDLSHAYSGPFATMHLADQGAEVIKIEVPGKGDQSRNWPPMKNGASGYYAYVNRNKYGLTLNLKSEEGKKVFRELVKNSDVVVENFRVGTMDRLGLGYEVLKEINPKIIYASISGFGLEGELAPRPCYDIVAQAMGGMMSMTGFPDRMVKVGPAIADNYSGTYLSLGIVMALFQRERTGLGRRLDVSMLDTIFSILETGVMEYTLSGKVATPQGNADPVIAPFDAFQAKDGMFVIACGTDKFFGTLCELMGQPELAEDPRFVTNNDRVEHYIPELKDIIEAWSMQHDLDEIEKLVVGAGIPFSRINNIQQACNLDVIRDRHMLWEVEDPGVGETICVPGTPIKMHGCSDEIQKAAPALGEDTERLLESILHMDEDSLAELKENGVI